MQKRYPEIQQQKGKQSVMYLFQRNCELQEKTIKYLTINLSNDQNNKYVHILFPKKGHINDLKHFPLVRCCRQTSSEGVRTEFFVALQEYQQFVCNFVG